MNKAPCCQMPSFSLPKARPLPPPCPACGCSPCACPAPCPQPCPAPCPPPCRCAPARRMPRYLIDRVVGFGSCHERCVCEAICLTRIPRAAVPPYTLQSVSACAQTPVIEEAPCCARRGLELLVTVPLDLVFTDANGNRFESTATLTRTVCVRLDCAAAECWRYRFTARACVRLIRRAVSDANNCFRAQLELLIEAYVTMACPVGGRPEPECAFDDRPLYPPPIYR